MGETYQNYIDGEWTDSETGVTFENRNPADRDDLVGYFQESSTEDANRAVEAAQTAADEWAFTPGPERGTILVETARLLDDRTDELIETLTREEGKTPAEATPKVQRAIDIFRYYAQKARDFRGTVKASSSRDTNLYTVNEPLGVAALVTPWNYPIAIPAWKLGPALATGNTVVFKPASQAPSVSRILFECLDAAGLPDGVANYVTGPGSEVGETFISHDAVDAVSFTGSAEVGEMVYDTATDDGKRVQTELGSKNPTIVMPSADLDEAVEIVGSGAFGVTGQACTATSRALVHESVHDEFLDRIVDYAESIDVGADLTEVEMGPQVSQEELDETLQYIEVGRGEGATLETGGNQLDEGEYEHGYFVEPTVFSGVDSSMRIAREEIFGPVLGVIPIGDFEEAITVANDVPFGLAANIVTQDLGEANRFVEDIEFGVAKVNEKTTGLELHVPFGGFKRSSSETYREQGEAGIDFFTITKTAYVNY